LTSPDEKAQTQYKHDASETAENKNEETAECTVHACSKVCWRQSAPPFSTSIKIPKNEAIPAQQSAKNVGNNVVVYSGATLFGADAVTGDNVVTGGNVWITSIAPPQQKC
jgi:hypothetical protein